MRKMYLDWTDYHSDIRAYHKGKANQLGHDTEERARENPRYQA